MLPSLDFSQDDNYSIHTLKRQFESNCTCPLQWIGNRRQYLPENADDLWDNDLWGDIPPNLPGQLDGYNEGQMMDIARRCEQVSNDIEEIYTQFLEFKFIIEQAHKDVLNTIYALVGHLHKVHRYQLRRKHRSNSRHDGWITEGYRHELGASVIDYWHVEAQVQDEMLGSAANKKGSEYKRRSPRAFNTRLEQVSHPRLRLSSSVTAASTLNLTAPPECLIPPYGPPCWRLA
ncbi:hypothetical protein LCI18_001968 [Fusarium solani-melongenae]|uniref:Uncharacterized protein n=1 Tax=Fusarium solani subsp. cucurbitae TaxID=2747967 RepID=A0ACD3YQ98_FUSSC|nr:hypothetical protein LCI18_001968 [Fusarium solani-melongenae]